MTEQAEQTEQNRAPRASDSREATKRKIQWSPGPNLPKPDDRPGLEFRYVRCTARGVVDSLNLSAAMRNYWTPVKASEYKELRVMSDLGSQFPEGVVIGGLVLCSRDSDIGDQIREYGDQEMQAQMEGVDNSYFKESDGGMRKFSDKHTRVNGFSDG